MKKLQAAMRDSAHRRRLDSRHCYKVGSVFKGCNNCGDTEEDEKGRIKYTSGFNVFRAYQPSWTGWTWFCWDCGAKDLECWAPDSIGMVEYELGKDAIRGTRDAIRERKYAIRKELTKLDGKVDVKVESDRDRQIKALEAKIEELKARMKR